MTKRILLALAGLMMSIAANAQVFHEEGYDYFYDYDHRVVLRSTVVCEEEMQDLWNGDYVRLNGYVYIYRGRTKITYGDKIWLIHTGYYIVERSGWQYLIDPDGNKTGVYGDIVNPTMSDAVAVYKSGWWYLYTSDGYRMGNIYSETEPSAYWNGYYSYQSGGYYRIATPDGESISVTYSDERPTLTNAGLFRVSRGGNYYLIDTEGNRVY
ncbi:MAG: hypothetical protein KBS55_03620 [Bacteroidales bacterium]|nr:hypothetical protein [Candidatus Cryptobacteroides aphodequi]